MSTSIPTPGTAALYYPAESDADIRHTRGQPLAATVCMAHNDHCVNLSVLGEDGVPHPRLAVPLLQFGQPYDLDVYSAGYCVLLPKSSELEAPIDAKFEVDGHLRDFFLRTVEALISQDRPDRTPFECAQKAWMVTDYVRSCLADLK